LKSGTPDFVSRLMATIQPLVDGQLLIGVESLLSTLNAADSRKSSSASARPLHDTQLNYLLRVSARHMHQGKPLGALAIQTQVLQLFEHACYVSCPSPMSEKAGFLTTKSFKQRFSVLDNLTITGIFTLASAQLSTIEASADFLRFKRSPHQDLSLSLKAIAIRLASISFVAGKEDATLPNVLKSILIDQGQMTHDNLAMATFDAIAAISINNHDHSADLNRSLRNYIVNTHGPSSFAKIKIAATRLAWCLSAISKDRVMSTLYSLVNVLSSGITERAAPLRPKTALSLMNFDQHTVASSISLSLKTEDQKQQVYSNVIEAIAEMVTELGDEKIAELMISLLGQKFGRVNDGVDKSLVWATAKISRIVSEKDFRRILKLHAKARIDPATASQSLTETVSLL
jgi:DNA-directed RNA polymerase subunit L